MLNWNRNFEKLLLFSGGVICGVLLTYFSSQFQVVNSKRKKKGPEKDVLSIVVGNKPLNFDEAGLPLRLLKKAETVLCRRTERLILVLERCTDSHNYTAVLRTAECLGVQYVWLIAPPVKSSEELNGSPSKEIPSVGRKTATKLKRKKGCWKADQKELQEAMGYGRRAQQWLTVRNFETSRDCLDALHKEKVEIWATDLSQEAIALDNNAEIRIPKKLAIVMGTESSGVSDFMLANADHRVYIPLRGFSDSLNLSVSAALMMQYFFYLCPEAEGDISENESSRLRKDWYAKLARNPEQEKLFSTYLSQPPLPFDDLRRPDEHRIAFISKKERKRDKNTIGST
mmetsp:Transcript_25914/g.33603  ORF Transcript_25914/g.33603 Transcript_25914/m.33603 type:complete len:342 (-) Transcript_25914:21-1046(-)